MDFLIFILFFLFFVVAASRALKSRGRQKFKYNPSDDWPFEKEKLLTNPEKVLYFRLIEALPDYCVFAQVQLSQLMSVKKGHDFKQWFNRINRMSADFVVTNKAMEIIAVIELDDRTHLRAGRVAADRKKDHALLSAGIEVIRCNVSEMPTVDKIKDFFNLSEKTIAPASVVGVRGKETPAIE